KILRLRSGRQRYWMLFLFPPQGYLSLRSGMFICGQFSFVLSQGRFCKLNQKSRTATYEHI
ncbi:MAG: hypothetical protein ACC650_09710, partial [Gammaproteobacteria bacterium]